MEEIKNIIKNKVELLYEEKHKEYFERVGVKERNFLSVKGGQYKPSFAKEEISVCNLFVSKYQVTQRMYEEIMGNNPSYCKGSNRPVEQVSWYDAIKYCNELSKIEGLIPTYKIENDILIKIVYKDGEEVSPENADFTQTEGYRLPTEAEWEWFARGGEIAIQAGTFNTVYAGNNNIYGVAWHINNSSGHTQAVGTRQPNELGIYDCSGNVCECCYDTATDAYIDEERPYIYNEAQGSWRLKGGSWCGVAGSCEVSARGGYSSAGNGCGFRVVRTV